MNSKKDIAKSFLRLASSGRVDEAFAHYVHPGFIHHNPYFRGDRASFQQAMEENARQFPNKTYEVLRVLEDGDWVAIHGKVVLTAESQWSVIHIFRFEDNLIKESWEASQQVIPDSPNRYGIF
ncbi:nuclear transport factor 2 family protein [Thermoflavifilum thermophilum]|uniref:Predicted SnoaL-like aldol condensation-catalyzing enzyme n=1 Tax=Thermoflavifilum thermophilum TaxID=1393122 RepID=A0A1I7NK08_9BACT|nr:nuclear transport factor 2 family protein [Thermoflavifilum thermophilum]SFV34983.1 Predicted SnoaL-like aldol condensation-catalyzing enzyme [Thermoflavifilum thermophilum]